MPDDQHVYISRKNEEEEEVREYSKEEKRQILYKYLDACGRVQYLINVHHHIYMRTKFSRVSFKSERTMRGANLRKRA